METGAKNEKKSVSLFRVGRLYSILTRKKKKLIKIRKLFHLIEILGNKQVKINNLILFTLLKIKSHFLKGFKNFFYFLIA